MSEGRAGRSARALAIAIATAALAAAALAFSAEAAQLITGQLVKNSTLTGRDVKNATLTGKDVKDGSLRPRDFKGSVVGPAGPQGPQGPAGSGGATGPQGATGPAGASGVVAVRSFDQTAWAMSIGANSILPQKCRTSAYVAGEGETAMVQVQATAAPQNLILDYLFVGVGMIVDGGAPTLEGSKNAEGMNDGAASSGALAEIELTAGRSYVFGPILSANSAGGITLASSTCHGTVTISRLG